MKEISQRAVNLKVSQTLALTELGSKLKKTGKDIVLLSAGEPDFDTPINIKEKAIEAINLGFTKYTAVNGIYELRKAICEKLFADNGLSYSPEEIVVSSGAKQCISNAVSLLIEPGDEVIIFAPYWVTYSEIVKFYSGVPIVVETSSQQGFEPEKNAFVKGISRKTKAILLNSPTNPTGAVYSQKTLEFIAKAAVENDIFVISDEIYEKLIYDGKHISIASINADIKERTIIVNGLSKSHAMTGWRVGYTASNQFLSSKIAAIQGQTSHHNCSISQWAAFEALSGTQENIKFMVGEFKNRRDMVFDMLQNADNIKIFKPNAAFYFFINIEKCLNKFDTIKNDIDFCSTLLEKHLTAVIPGSAFGMENHIRISFATSETDLKKGCQRLLNFLSEF